MAADKTFVSNPNVKPSAPDVLYHFGLSTETTDFPATFGDVRFVLCGGSAGRMKRLYEELVSSQSLQGHGDLSRSERFVLYKAGPVLCVSHGMGVPSMSVMLVETLKLLHHAGASRNVAIIRVGTSGGIGLEPGTVVVSSGALNGLLREVHVQYVLGERVERAAPLDEGLHAALAEVGKGMDFPVAEGRTMCTDDFYEGQGRLDGAFCDYEAAAKMAFLRKAHGLGVRNIEMESTGFASFTHRAGVRGAIVCVALLDRLQGDQVSTPKAALAEFEQRPIRLVAEFVRRQLAMPNGL